MPTSYVWQFPRLDVYPTYETVTDAVFRVHWRLTADNGAGRTAESYGVQSCGPIDTSEFTPYDELTELEVQGWVEAEMGAELDQVKADLDARLQEAVAPTRLSLPPPW